MTFVSSACSVCVVVAIAGFAAASGNIVANPGFENNTGGNHPNQNTADFNARMADVFEFGTGQEVDIFQGTGGFGPTPFDGDYKVALHHTSSAKSDAIAMGLTEGLGLGGTYELNIHAAWIEGASGPFVVGISQDPNSFGTQIMSVGAVLANNWGSYGTSFVSPVGGTAYLTFEALGPSSWIHLDGVSLVAVPGPTAGGLFGVAGIGLLRRRR